MLIHLIPPPVKVGTLLVLRPQRLGQISRSSLCSAPGGCLHNCSNLALELGDSAKGIAQHESRGGWGLYLLGTLPAGPHRSYGP